MSIRIDKTQEGKTIIELENGHIEALKKIIDDYNLLGEKEAISFMLSVFSQANGKKITVEGVNFVPSTIIKKPVNNESTN
jgi:hypothetical protein